MLLETINSPKDLKKLSLAELNILAQEIRKEIIEVVSQSGGHLASSLGCVELAISLHYCLDTPSDVIIWDVGHQAYAHKLLTGRRDDFKTLRQLGGISGFLSKDESIYDPFTSGHSSTAVSLGLGVATSRDLNPENPHFNVVTIIGDGSLSGGLCFEALNNAGHLNKDMLVVLNTNEMSISPVVGALSTYLNKIISLPIYNRFRANLEKFIQSRVPKGGRLLKLADKFEEGLKGLFVPGIFFEELGFRYFGPLDGHNLELLISTLKNILSLKGPILLHVITKKGKGYRPAEQEPVRFHSAGPFEISTGKAKLPSKDTMPTYTEVFSSKLVDLANKNKQIVAITAAMPEGTGLDRFRDRFPGRFFDVGIAEAHAIAFAAGLAKYGLRPVVAIYSTFLQRAYDQIIEEIALQNLPVILAIDRAGIVGEDGPTHQGLFDIAYLRNIPNVVVMAPKDTEELGEMLEFATRYNGPIALRYPKSFCPLLRIKVINTGNVFLTKKQAIQLGKAEILKEEGKDLAIFALGSMVYPALEAMEILSKEGIKATLVNSRFAKPIDKDLFMSISSGVKEIVTIEEGVLEGGFGSATLELLDRPIRRIGLPSKFITHGKRELLLKEYGLTKEGIANSLLAIFKRDYAQNKNR